MLLRKKLFANETPEQFHELNHQPENNDHIANYILEHNGQLPPHPMFEKHPYLDDFELQDFDKYIIGTFPPISYIYDHPLMVENGIYAIYNNGVQMDKPQFPAFHGNMGSMWKYFFYENELNELQNIVNQGLRIEARDFIYKSLSNIGINYADIIKHARHEDYDASDAGLYNINPNLALIVHILNNPKAKYLNFNSSTLFNNPNSGFGVISNNRGQNVAGNLKEEPKSLNLFLLSLQKLGFKLELALPGEAYYTINQQNANFINDTFKLKVLVNLRISIATLKIENTVLENIEREFLIIVGASPSGGANIPMGANQIYQNWLQAQPENIQIPTTIFRKQFYNLFRNNNWEALQSMNVNI